MNKFDHFGSDCQADYEFTIEKQGFFASNWLWERYCHLFLDDFLKCFNRLNDDSFFMDCEIIL